MVDIAIAIGCAILAVQNFLRRFNSGGLQYKMKSRVWLVPALLIMILAGNAQIISANMRLRLTLRQMYLPQYLLARADLSSLPSPFAEKNITHSIQQITVLLLFNLKANQKLPEALLPRSHLSLPHFSYLSIHPSPLALPPPQLLPSYPCHLLLHPIVYPASRNTRTL